ncbi:hypothetical protein C8R46DRAFT_1213965 [Mycena filopes]|nr:hypothetical protein C8R46DRAFT_1213965 [Mycena filopes]
MYLRTDDPDLPAFHSDPGSSLRAASLGQDRLRISLRAAVSGPDTTETLIKQIPRPAHWHPLHRDKEAFNDDWNEFNDDWNEFNDLGHSANKFRPIGSNIRSVSCSSVEYPFGFLFVGKLVFFPALIAVSSFLFVPVQPLHRDKDAFNDD